MNLGALIRQLETAPQEHEVMFNFGYFKPQELRSYRGYYEHLALGYTDQESYKITVRELLSILKSAIGNVFEGYKGGAYAATADRLVYVSNWGDVTGTTILSVQSDEVRTYLMTGNEDVDDASEGTDNG